MWNVDKLTASMWKNGWQGAPIDVFEYGNVKYVVDGHHRLVAAKRAEVNVPFNRVTVEGLPSRGCRTVDDIISANVEVGSYRLVNKHKRRR
ncbi:ParB N-terminal domain-containing protein [Saccharothrix longispora]|uniref:ParB N-terminal domain-containing protein n=1 Tax=Saccharothrix longispora TaxID=33920 RepID=UPI00398C84CC